MSRGRVALVTGGGRGIGAAAARRLAADGLDVAVAGRSRAALEEVAAEVTALGRRSLVVDLDQRDEQAAEDAVAATVADLGGLDVLVANSGVAGGNAPLWETPLDDWAETQAVNVTGTFLVCRAAARHLVPQGSGSVVVVGSVTGKRPMRGRTPYAASKAALVGLVRTAAADAGPHGVRVNLVSPGPVAGERLDAVLDGIVAAGDAGDRDAALAALTGGAAIPRAVTPEEVAAAVSWLAGDDAAGVTGQDLNVSAGMVMY